MSAYPLYAAPKSASASAKIVIRKSVTTMATKRGAMRKAMGSMASVAQRVDLLGDDHGPELGGVVGADAARDHQRGEQRRDLAQRAEARAPAEQALGAVALHERRRLDDHDGAREERRDDDDRERLDRHLVEVALDLRPVDAAAGRTRRARMRPKSTPMPPTVSAIPRNGSPGALGDAARKPAWLRRRRWARRPWAGVHVTTGAATRSWPRQGRARPCCGEQSERPPRRPAPRPRETSACG